MKRTRSTALIIILLIVVAFPVFSQTVKLASVAPIGSPWHTALRELSAKWAAISGGKIQMKLYMGGIAGDEQDMLRKMRIGQIQAAAVTALALNRISPEVLALSVPFLIRNDAEMDYVMERTRPYFIDRIEEKGFQVLTLSKAGWVHFFARAPVFTPEDLKRLRLSVTAGDPDILEVWQSLGFQVVPLAIPDIMVGLQSGMVDAFYAPPLVTAGYQWFGIAPNMCSVKVAPVVGAIIIGSRTWQAIPDEIKPALLAAVEEVDQRLYNETSQLESEAMRVMQKAGLQVNQASEADTRAWEVEMARGFDFIVGRSFSRETYDLIVGHLEALRSR